MSEAGVKVKQLKPTTITVKSTNEFAENGKPTKFVCEQIGDNMDITVKGKPINNLFEFPRHCCKKCGCSMRSHGPIRKDQDVFLMAQSYIDSHAADVTAVRLTPKLLETRREEPLDFDRFSDRITGGNDEVVQCECEKPAQGSTFVSKATLPEKKKKKKQQLKERSSLHKSSTRMCLPICKDKSSKPSRTPINKPKPIARPKPERRSTSQCCSIKLCNKLNRSEEHDDKTQQSTTSTCCSLKCVTQPSTQDTEPNSPRDYQCCVLECVKEPRPPPAKKPPVPKYTPMTASRHSQSGLNRRRNAEKGRQSRQSKTTIHPKHRGNDLRCCIRLGSVHKNPSDVYRPASAHKGSNREGVVSRVGQPIVPRSRRKQSNAVMQTKGSASKEVRTRTKPTQIDGNAIAKCPNQKLQNSLVETKCEPKTVEEIDCKCEEMQRDISTVKQEMSCCTTELRYAELLERIKKLDLLVNDLKNSCRQSMDSSRLSLTTNCDEDDTRETHHVEYYVRPEELQTEKESSNAVGNEMCSQVADIPSTTTRFSEEQKLSVSEISISFKQTRQTVQSEQTQTITSLQDEQTIQIYDIAFEFLKKQDSLRSQQTSDINAIHSNLDSGSRCQLCEHKNVNTLTSGLIQAVQRISAGRRARDIILTIIMEDHNLYHVTVTDSSSSKSIGCLYATEYCMREAKDLHLFEDYLTFFVVNARCSSENSDKLLSHTFEYLKF